MSEYEAPHTPIWRRLLWFGGLWLVSVLVIAAVAYGIRIWLV